MKRGKDMQANYSIEQLREIAEECREFEHVINAMGYGFSLLNESDKTFVRRCDECVNWQDGYCQIFAKEIMS